MVATAVQIVYTRLCEMQRDNAHRALCHRIEEHALTQKRIRIDIHHLGSQPTSKPVIVRNPSGYAVLLSLSMPARRRHTWIGYNKCSACGKPGCLLRILRSNGGQSHTWLFICDEEDIRGQLGRRNLRSEDLEEDLRARHGPCLRDLVLGRCFVREP
jgi:hypothetical protein